MEVPTKRNEESTMTTEIVLLAGSIIMKESGLLVSLGIENFVSAVDAQFLYNLISVAIILFIAAFSGPRSEAAFCIIVPIFAGIFEWFGWMRLATTTATQGLIALTIIMGLLGVFIYMKDQNAANYGVVGPGSPIMNVVFYLMCFSAALTLIHGFSIFPVGPTQTISGTCAVGFTCDAYNNIDFSSTIGSIGNTGGLVQSAVSAITGLLGATIAMFMLIINILAGIALFPVILADTIKGIFPDVINNAAYIAFISVTYLIIAVIYALGMYELITKPTGGIETI